MPAAGLCRRVLHHRVGLQELLLDARRKGGGPIQQFLVIGLFDGTLYALLAVGLVLVYRGTRVFNFAQGEFGTVAVFVVYALFTNARLPYGVAVVIGLVCAVLLGLIVERLVIRPLFKASRITVLVATVGTALLIIAITVLVAKPEPRDIDPAIAGDPVSILGASISPQQFLVVGVLAVVAVLLALFFRTDRGLAMLATSQDPFASRVVGISLVGMSRLTWGMAALLGGVAGILQGPVVILTPGFMTTIFLVPAFTGAVLGGMTSLVGAFLGGLLVGVFQNVGIFYLGQQLNVPGASQLTLLGLLLLVLLVRPRGLLGTEA